MSRIESGGVRLLVDCSVTQGREAGSWSFRQATLLFQPTGACRDEPLLRNDGAQCGERKVSCGMLLNKFTFDYWICLWCGAVFQTATEPCPVCGSPKNVCMRSPLMHAEVSRLLTNLSNFGEYASASIDR